VLATILKGDHDELEMGDLRWSDARLDQIKDMTLEGKFQILNKLKASIPEAFYYWWLVSEMDKS
jgi:hypothetical protein